MAVTCFLYEHVLDEIHVLNEVVIIEASISRIHAQKFTMSAMASSARVTVYVQPSAKRTEIAGRHGTDLKIRVAAPPIEQAANEALLAFVALKLGVRQRSVRLIAGATNRRKVLEIEGITAEQIGILLR